MKSTILRSAAIGTLVLLGACGGGGSGGGGGPAPIPPSPPPPPPPPPPVYSTLPLKAFDEFQAITARREFISLESDQLPLPYSIVSSDVSSRNASFKVRYDPDSQFYTIVNNGVESEFGPMQRYLLADWGEVYFSGNWTSGFTISNVSQAITVPFEITYTGFGRWEGTTERSNRENTYFLIGYPTVSTDLPRTGAATYATYGYGDYMATGTVPEAAYLMANINFTASFGTGAVQTSLNMYRSAELPADVITLSGSGLIGSGSSEFNGLLSGTFLPTGTAMTGEFAGGFFGPAAAEMGYAFSADGKISDTSQVNVTGVVVGKKQ